MHPVLKELKEKVGKGQVIGDLLRDLSRQLPGIYPAAEDEVILLKSRWSTYERERDAGLKPAQELETAHNKLVFDFLSLLNRIERMRTEEANVSEGLSPEDASWLSNTLSREDPRFKKDQEPKRNGPPPPPVKKNTVPPPALPNLAGYWRTTTGLVIQFYQSGNQLSFQGVNQFGIVVTQGAGTIFGDRVHLQYQITDGLYTYNAQAQLQLSPDGTMMQGNSVYPNGYSEIVMLTRQG